MGGHVLARVADGDQAAFEQLYHDEFSTVLHTTWQVLIDRAQAEEVTQEVFLEIWCGAAAHYDVRLGDTRTWLATVARRRAIDRVRQVQSARDREALVTALDAAPTAADPADDVEARTELDRVQHALLRMRSDQRDLLDAAFLHSVPYHELAERLQIPVNTVKSRVRLALDRLRTIMATERTPRRPHQPPW